MACRYDTEKKPIKFLNTVTLNKLFKSIRWQHQRLAIHSWPLRRITSRLIHYVWVRYPSQIAARKEHFDAVSFPLVDRAGGSFTRVP